MPEQLPKAFDAYLKNLESLTNEVRRELDAKKEKSRKNNSLLIIEKNVPEAGTNHAQDKAMKTRLKIEPCINNGLTVMKTELQEVLVELDSFRKERENLANILS